VEAVIVEFTGAAGELIGRDGRGTGRQAFIVLGAQVQRRGSRPILTTTLTIAAVGDASQAALVIAEAAVAGEVAALIATRHGMSPRDLGVVAGAPAIRVQRVHQSVPVIVEAVATSSNAALTLLHSAGAGIGSGRGRRRVDKWLQANGPIPLPQPRHFEV